MLGKQSEDQGDQWAAGRGRAPVSLPGSPHPRLGVSQTERQGVGETYHCGGGTDLSALEAQSVSSCAHAHGPVATAHPCLTPGGCRRPALGSDCSP